MQSNTQRIVLAGAVTAALIAVPLAIAQDSMPPKSGAVAPVPDQATPPSQGATQDLPPHLPPPAAAPMQPMSPSMIPAERGAPPPMADAPPPPHQRFTFTPVMDGILRLDGESGQVTICNTRTLGWACQAVPEDRAALETEIDRLQADNRALKRDVETLKADNQTLKDKIAALTAPPPPPVPPQTVPPQNDKSDTPQLNPAPPSVDKPGQSPATSGQLKLPSKEDLEHARVMLQDAWRRLVEMLGQWQDQMRRS